MVKLLQILLLSVASGASCAQVSVRSILGASRDDATSLLSSRGYEVHPYGEDPSSYKAIFRDRSKEYMDGNFTVCKGRVVSAAVGLDPDAEYPIQMASLIAEYGQPNVKVETAHLKGGDATYIDFRWSVGTEKIALSDTPPSRFWAATSPHRTVVLSLHDNAQTCFFSLPDVGEDVDEKEN
ncbi:hypothetical protein [Pandoraea sputorum]|uniref:hypothetical protein n=1 Tax=Pandoraea sputorum TaxID=93222 RepID=UPI002F3E84D0